MVKRTFLTYLLLELAVVAALTWTIGLGWTLLVLLATSGAGVALAGSQVRRQISRLQQLPGSPQGAAADSMLVALGTVLVFVPGLVSTALGALLLLPPTRGAVRPVAAAVLNRAVLRQVPVVTSGGYRTDFGAGPAAYSEAGPGGYIEGEILDEPVVGRIRDVRVTRSI